MQNKKRHLIHNNFEQMLRHQEFFCWKVENTLFTLLHSISCYKPSNCFHKVSIQRKKKKESFLKKGESPSFTLHLSLREKEFQPGFSQFSGLEFLKLLLQQGRSFAKKYRKTQKAPCWCIGQHSCLLPWVQIRLPQILIWSVSSQ